jgi:peroxiredoxin
MPLLACSQSFTLKGKIAEFPSDKITIHDFYGNENRMIDSISVNKDGAFIYNFPTDAYAGMYRLRWGKSQFMDIIFNAENIEFTTHNQSVVDSLDFSKSIENQLYFNYLKDRNENEYRLELLHPLLNMYPKDDPFYSQITRHYDSMNNQLTAYIENVIAANSATFASKVIRADFTPRPPAALTEDQHINFLRTHFFDNIDFTDTTLLFSNVIANKIIQYLSLYQNNRLDKDQLEVEFIKAVNVIMDKTIVSPTVYEYAMDYLITGFNSYGFDRVITYIADNINLDEQCYDSERKAELEKKVESLKKFAVGMKAPDFEVNDLAGKPVKLSAINSEYTLLVFWATWCPHCNNLVKDLQKIYLPNNTQKLEIVAVSLDDNSQELNQFLKEGQYDWINICDYKKWKGELVQTFDIFATPTMFLLYNDLTIVAKPITYNELKDELFKRNILK